MLYLKSFNFPSEAVEYNFILDEKRTCFDTFYPFKILSKNDFERIDFEPVTILYGGNGSGKSTALNAIAEKVEVLRDSIFNKSNFFGEYVSMSEFEIENEIVVIPIFLRWANFSSVKRTPVVCISTLLNGVSNVEFTSEKKSRNFSFWIGSPVPVRTTTLQPLSRANCKRL